MRARAQLHSLLIMLTSHTMLAAVVPEQSPEGSEDYSELSVFLKLSHVNRAGCPARKTKHLQGLFFFFKSLSILTCFMLILDM